MMTMSEVDVMRLCSQCQATITRTDECAGACPNCGARLVSLAGSHRHHQVYCSNCSRLMTVETLGPDYYCYLEVFTGDDPHITVNRVNREGSGRLRIELHEMRILADELGRAATRVAVRHTMHRASKVESD
jgi:predicted RNA-binding Zn-ribbon protein involved in translation (DUF1610 family)